MGKQGESSSCRELSETRELFFDMWGKRGAAYGEKGGELLVCKHTTQAYNTCASDARALKTHAVAHLAHCAGDWCVRRLCEAGSHLSCPAVSSGRREYKRGGGGVGGGGGETRLFLARRCLQTGDGEAGRNIGVLREGRRGESHSGGRIYVGQNVGALIWAPEFGGQRYG